MSFGILVYSTEHLNVYFEVFFTLQSTSQLSMDGFISVHCLYSYSKMTKNWQGATPDVHLGDV